MKFINLNTSEVVNISGLKKSGEFIVSGEQGGRPEGPRFCAKWAHIITEQHNEAGEQYFTINDGWQLVATGERKSRQPKAKKDEPKPKDEQPEAVEVISETIAKGEPQPQVEDTKDDEQALIAAIKNLRGGQVDDAKVAKKAGEVFHENFEDVKKRISRGQWVYLYGPTGSGKTCWRSR